jgi:hypothetical protein
LREVSSDPVGWRLEPERRNAKEALGDDEQLLTSDAASSQILVLLCYKRREQQTGQQGSR